MRSQKLHPRKTTFSSVFEKLAECKIRTDCLSSLLVAYWTQIYALLLAQYYYEVGVGTV